MTTSTIGTKLGLRKLTARIGAEVTGVSSGLELDPETVTAIFTSTGYETVHPVVRVHPLTGERCLFIGGFAHRIAGLSTGESKDILRHRDEVSQVPV